MLFSNIIIASACWLCSLLFGIIALWAFRRKDPMHFWSGSTVKPDEIADIKSYNRSNGIMWATYTICMATAGVVSLFDTIIGVILMIIIIIPGIIVLIIIYNQIYKKYSTTLATNKRINRVSKTPKGVFISITSIVLIILIGFGWLFSYGEKDPEVSILEDQIQINSIYGLSISISEISEILLIDKSVNELDIGTRVNGYDGFGDALKGNFKSKTLGETLLFVQVNSSPIIKIARINNKDVYISLSKSDSTLKLYQDLISFLSN